MMFQSKILHITAYAILATATVFMIFVAWLVIWPVSPGTEIKSIVVPDVVTAGEMVNAEVEYCKTINGPAVSTYTLETESGLAFYTAPIESNRPIGCDRAVIQVSIPESAPAGTAIYEVDVRRQYNPFHSDTISAESNQFLIIRDS
jgi:hypothetical protein